MLNRHFYHEIIRKTIIGFGTLFNNIELRRVDKSGKLIQTIKVPLGYGPREKFLARIEAEPNLDPASPMQIQLPRIAFELKGISYDSSRKLSPIQICKTPIEGESTKVYTHYTPVPYNLDFELSIISKNNDDAVQILEQILPFFQPQFNITIKLIEETSELKDIPILLNTVNIQDDYEGDFRQRRSLVYTLNFVAKTYLYGPVTTSDVIKRVNTDIGTAINTGSRYVRYSASPAALQDYTNDGTGIRSLDINPDSNTITLVNHGFVTGDFVTYRSDPNGTLIGGLEDLSEYYIIKIDNDNFRLSNTRYNSQRGLAVDITSQGVGNNHKFSIINFIDDQFVEPDDDFGFNESWTDLS
jgi:hypothetical protein